MKHLLTAIAFWLTSVGYGQLEKDLVGAWQMMNIRETPAVFCGVTLEFLPSGTFFQWHSAAHHDHLEKRNVMYEDWMKTLHGTFEVSGDKIFLKHAYGLWVYNVEIRTGDTGDSWMDVIVPNSEDEDGYVELYGIFRRSN